MTGPVDTKLDPLPKDVEDLLDHERRTAAPPPEGAEQAVLSAVTATVLTAGLVAGTASATPTTAVASSATAAGATTTAAGAAASGAVHATVAGKVATGVVLFLLGGLSGAGGHALYVERTGAASPAAPPVVEIARPVAQPLPSPDPAPEPEAVAAVPQTPVLFAVAAPPRPAHAQPAADKRGAEPTERISDTALAGERGILDIAHTALARGQTDGAIAELEKHARLYPKGQLAEEREALWVQALVGAGRYADARARGAQFGRQFPKSMLLPTVRATLESIP